jgi:hypothetical protein
MIVENEQGGRQSKIDSKLTLIPPKAVIEVGKVMLKGESSHGRDNWRLIPLEDHLDHGLLHIMEYLAGNTDEDHLAHAATRLLMALELKL